MDIRKIYAHIYAHKMSKPSEEQIRYAVMLSKGMKVGLIALIVTFFLYVSGIVPPHIPKDTLSEFWHLPVAEYLHSTGIETGWNWLFLIKKGDFLNFVGIVFLSGVTIICFIGIIPIFLRKKDTIYAIIAFVEVLVLVFAASGILKTGGH